MEPIDNIQNVLKKLNEKDSRQVLTSIEAEQWDLIPREDKERYLTDLISRPVAFGCPAIGIIYTWYFRWKWIEALKSIHKEDAITVYEVGPGGSDIIPQAVDKAFDSSESRYITSNLNKELTAIFKSKTQNLSLNIQVIEDDAVNMNEVIPDNSVDAVVFEHSVNDVIETILAEKNGIDTVNSDWMNILEPITEIENREYSANTLEANAKTEFLSLIHSCIKVLKPGGFIVCAHYQFQDNLDLGLNPELNENYLNIARGWINSANIGKEVFVDGYNPRWWLFIQKQ